MNEYKPGWEQTMMAEDIFKAAVAEYMAHNHSSCHLEEHKPERDKKLLGMADVAMDAAVLFRNRQKERKFPDMVMVGTAQDV